MSPNSPESLARELLFPGKWSFLLNREKLFNNPLSALALGFLISLILISVSSASGKKSSGFPEPLCPTIELPQLMAWLSQEGEKTARFREEKVLGFLQEPLKAEGTLHFKAPGYLEKIIENPTKERLVLENDLVIISYDDPQYTRTFSLDNHPPLRQLLNSILFILGGNLNALMEHYHLTLIGTCYLWDLVMVPKSDVALNYIEEIKISGKKGDVLKIEWLEPNGDSTIMFMEKEGP